ncbi:MAG: hypothetical protein QXK26_03800 [Candidatus Bathyarchaeia archaeon]
MQINEDKAISLSKIEKKDFAGEISMLWRVQIHTPCTTTEPTTVRKENLVNFMPWLKKRGNRDSTIERKVKYLKALYGSVEEMLAQVLSKSWGDKSMECALEVVRQYGEFGYALCNF